MANLDSVLKSKTSLTNIHRVKAIVFPVVRCGIGPLRRLSAKELMLLHCGAREDS